VINLSRIAIITAFLIATTSAFANEAVIAAEPFARVKSAASDTAREKLSSSEAKKNALVISKSGSEYIWATRQSRQLVYVQSGAFHLFIDPRGGGYVKVFDQHALPEAMRQPGPRFRWYEHVSIGLETITYWGEANAFQP
jgi:hypothetical protein